MSGPHSIPTHARRWRTRIARTLATSVPVLCTALPLGEPNPAPPGQPPPPHAVDVTLTNRQGVAVSAEWQGLPGPHTPLHLALGQKPNVDPIWLAPTGRALAEGFHIVGNVAVMPGDDLTVSTSGTGFGVNIANLKELSRRFIRSFGDDYDQVAVFLGFSDRMSLESLAYQIPVKNDVEGLGLGIFDATGEYGSPSGRMQTMLNMKRVSVYGIDAAENPEDVLYPVWAQESAHRWLTYFRYRFPADGSNRDDILGRQKAHWARWVHSEASVMDGVSWQENGDGTFTVLEADKRFGALDQYAMGLRPQAEVPAFFMLDEFVDSQGDPIKRNEISISRRQVYQAKKIPLTVDDIVRAVGKRKPESGGAAVDLRMAVVFLAPPGATLGGIIGESFLVDQTRAPWDTFYNIAGGGRGKVCTELLRPCRGPSFVYGTPVLQVAGKPVGIAAPLDRVSVNIPITNKGDEAAAANVTAALPFGLTLDTPTASTAPLAPGQTGSITLTGTLAANAPCGFPIKLDLFATGRLGPSRSDSQFLIGMEPVVFFDFEAADAAAAWTVNPEKNDTATAGAWEIATPQKTVASVLSGFVVQPEGAFSGTRALVTGAAAGENESDNDVDFDAFNPIGPGRTSVQSALLDLSRANNPMLSYRVHFEGVSFGGRILIPATNDNMHVLGSADGSTWVELDRLRGLHIGWQHRIVNLAEAFGGTAPAQISLRFVVEDDPFEANPVEAVIDDVGIFAQSTTCTTSRPPPPVDMPPVTMPPPGDPPGGGGGCAIGGPAQPVDAGPGAFLLLLIGLQVLVRRRRRG